MTSVPTPRMRCFALALLFSIVSVDDGIAKTARSSSGRGAVAESTSPSSAALDLAEQVAEIAHSNAISRAKKEKRISTAVRIAVVSATAYKNSPEEILGTTLELTEAAAAAAPNFAEVIANAISFAPSLGRIEGAPGQVRTAAFAAAKNPKGARKTKAVAAKTRKSAAQPSISPKTSTIEHPERSIPTEEPASESATPDYVADSAPSEEPSRVSKVSLDSNSNFSVSADLSVSRDSNVYLTSTGEKSDTIIALSPGFVYRFGQNSLSHGSVSYKNAITRYVDKSSPNVALSNAAANFGYDNGNLTVAGNALFQQLNQNNSAVAALGQNAIFRRDVLGLNTSIESHLTAKTSLRSGINFNKSDYKSGGLVGSQETSVPLSFFFATTPKVSLSTGLAYRRVKPSNGGATSRDLDYNIGARGNFTAKLSGELTLDYRTRQVATNPRENLWGINGSVNYELTPKSSASLVITNDFSTGALGESLKNNSYALRLSADPTPQWQLGMGLTYRRVDFGSSVFSLNNVPTLVSRTDNSWDSDVQATYLFNSWLSASANLTLRKNSSSLAAAEYTNNIISLMLGWRY